MNIDNVFEFVDDFNKGTHGTTDYFKDTIFVVKGAGSFAPLSFLKKKVEGFKEDSLIETGYIYDSMELIGSDTFAAWYENQFQRKLKRVHAKKILFLHKPENNKIFEAVETVNRCFEALREEKILFNGKKLPVQLGEWYAKCIFGLMQNKSTSQRGFDFFIDDKRVEVKVHWADHTSPKGVKLRKSLIDLSEYVIVIYVARNLMIREVCFLDSDFVLRKFSGKGHTVFLKDVDISSYFFSKSTKHKNKVVNSTALLKYALPSFAMNLAEDYSN